MVRRCMLAAAVVIFAACGGGGDDNKDHTDAPPPIDAFEIPVLHNPVALDDLTLAQQASTLLGVGGGMKCDHCHALTREGLQAWASLTVSAGQRCLQNLMPTTAADAQTIVDCFRDQPGVVSSGWPPHQLGVYATAANLRWFEYVFQLAYGADAATQLQAFRGEASMPRGDNPALTQDEFDIVIEWFIRGLPLMEAVVPADPPPTNCVQSIAPDVANHVNAMQTQGWRAINKDNGILMFGCAGAATTRDCLSTYPQPSDASWSSGWDSAFPTGKLRILREQTYSSSYWTRSSADGRYVAHGGAAANANNYRATVIDLERNVEIPADALYDPGFFPDNSGFVIQGNNPNARFCEQSYLGTNPTAISFNDTQCRKTSAVGLYQHLGAAHGGDYWTIFGEFHNDNGGHTVTSADPSSTFPSTAQVGFVPMVHTGTQFVPKPEIDVSLPFEGDSVISPSSKLFVSRVGGTPTGLLMRRLVATPNGTSYTLDTPEVARYCVRADKPAFSYDERWMVFHHYVEAGDWQSLGYTSATDAGFTALRAAGASNIFLLELTTGQVRRITTMNAGQYALYPHFRSDGWIYFLVRDRNRAREEIVASDAALSLE